MYTVIKSVDKGLKKEIVELKSYQALSLFKENKIKAFYG